MTDLSDDEQVKTLLNTHADYYSAPENLRAQITQLAKVKQAKASSFWFDWLRPQFGQTLASTAFGAAIATLLTSLWMANQQNKNSLFLALAADHARAIVTENTIEVRSADMHTVKPWLSSKLGYSPQIANLAEQGFPLVGGRRGFMGATPVAVAVYSYKQHEIDVYALPNKFQYHSAAQQSTNGFNAVSWNLKDFHYLAISDMNAKQLKVFSETLAQKQATEQ